MDALQAIVLGIVQGLTEFLPISSTAHLRIVPAFAGWDDPGAAFTAVTQLGTMTAVLAYFRRDLWRIGRAWLRSLTRPDQRATTEARLGWFILLGTIPIGVFGLIFSDQIETGARQLTLIGCTLIALGLVLLLAERVGTRRRKLETLTLRDGIAIGFAQAAALVPGVSRSGATISAGLFLGLERAEAARYSFLLSVPAVVLSGLFELRDIGGPARSTTAARTTCTRSSTPTGCRPATRCTPRRRAARSRTSSSLRRAAPGPAAGRPRPAPPAATTPSTPPSRPTSPTRREQP